MEIFVPKKSCLLPMLFCVMLSATASAHTLWINCSDYTPNFSTPSVAKTKIYMGWGHHFPVDSFVKAEDFTNISVLSPSSKTENVTLETTGFAAKQLSLKEEGLYVIAVTRRDAYNTSYKENGKLVLAKETSRRYSFFCSAFGQAAYSSTASRPAVFPVLRTVNGMLSSVPSVTGRPASRENSV